MSDYKPGEHPPGSREDWDAYNRAHPKPGSWHWDDHDGSTGGRGGDLLDADDVPVIATIPTGPDSARIEAATRRDAALIAAAPELLEVLRDWYSEYAVQLAEPDPEELLALVGKTQTLLARIDETKAGA